MKTTDHQAEISISELILKAVFSQKNKFILFDTSDQIYKKISTPKVRLFLKLISNSYKTDFYHT